MRNSFLKIFFIAITVIYVPSLRGACGSFAFAQWKAYLSYYEPTDIEQANDGTLYVLASGGLYSYNPKNHQLTTFDKTTVLNDCGISHIAWCQAAKRLVIVYDNYNIDLLSPNGNVVNMPAYMNTSMTVDKTVYSLAVSGNYTYISTAFGIIQLNASTAEFSNTYNLGFKVNYSYIEGNYIYAASSTKGIYRGSLTDNLLDPSKWIRTANFKPLSKTIDPDMLATVRTLKPGGPKYNHFGAMIFKYGNLYTVSGGYQPALELNYPGTVQVLRNNDNWHIYQDSLQYITNHAYIDNICIDVNPTDTSDVYVGGRTGLYKFRSGRFIKEYNIDNSPLQSAEGTNKNYVLIEGLTFDASGNLWILNSAASNQSVLKLSNNGEFTSYHSSSFVSPENNLSFYSMISPYIDSRSILWFGNQHWYTPGLYGYNTANGNTYAFANITNEDGTVYNDCRVKAIAEDGNHNLWIGTNIGPFMIEENQLDIANPVFTQVKVPRNDGTNYADYLLSGVDITAIVIDKSNRKWFGTGGNGIYLISSNNIQQIHHFTKDNSPLLSDNITSIALNEATGEMYIGTDKGLCSYTSRIPNADEGMTKDNVYAYPNPVSANYTGAITIIGLDESADVKIMTSNGTLVNEGKANGGQYKWYGLDNNGKRVTSGVYMVAVATTEGEKGVVCKIAIIR